MSTDKTNPRTEISGEFALIREVFAPLADTVAARGLDDDAAVFASPSGTETIVTTDTMSAGVHFRMEDGAASAAARVLASNLSDLAAMAAEPFGYTLAISVPKDLPLEWFRTFAARLAEDQTRYGIALLGGDTTRTLGPLSLTVTAFGHAPAGAAVSRNGAAPGDDIWISGTVGDAYLGLQLLTGDIAELNATDADDLRERFLFPEPRLALRELLRGHATAAIDVSDGLLADAGHIADASGVSMDLSRDDIPLSRAGRAALGIRADLWPRMMTGGDDYEIVFTASTGARPAIDAYSRDRGVPIGRIGTVGAAAEAFAIRVIGPDGLPVPVPGPGGYDHFATAQQE